MIQILDKLRGSRLAAIFRDNFRGRGDFRGRELHGKKRRNTREAEARGCGAIVSHR
jgi:hypothetical protein